ncbi:MAG: hypothetical protein R3302_04840, partial [Sulfurimonadaceae bacterium]|nr:hypothetical protein [Sulfurimonadaceae bacterium]
MAPATIIGMIEKIKNALMSLSRNPGEAKENLLLPNDMIRLLDYKIRNFQSNSLCTFKVQNKLVLSQFHWQHCR